MIVYPNCKINLGLHILGKRADGFHDLQTVFYPVKLVDALEVIHSSELEAITFSLSGISIPGSIEENICYKAWQLVKADYPNLPPLKMHLHKAIPPGSGLGAGSSDGANCLLLLNKVFNLSIPTDQLMSYAETLGSDCPFFLLNKPSIATGRGEHLETIDLDLSSYKIMVVIPPLHINTGWAFSQLTSFRFPGSVADTIKKPIEQWKDLLTNDFEAPVFKAHPEIKSAKDNLYASGAFYASLSGSGSALYGIFPADAQPSVSFPDSYFVKLLS